MALSLESNRLDKILYSKKKCHLELEVDEERKRMRDELQMSEMCSVMAHELLGYRIVDKRTMP